MLFTDWKVLLGILILWAAYYSPIARRHQVHLLIFASLAIYAYEAPTVLSLLLFSAGLNSVASYLILRASTRRGRAVCAATGVALNLLVLGFFKYNRLLYDLVGHELTGGGDALRTMLMLPLPIGISFYSFHGISLLVDTLRGGTVSVAPNVPDGSAGVKQFPTHLRDTFLYLCFFPQLVAGPITKANYFYPQIGAKSYGDIRWSTAADALIVGYFLKLVVANNLANHTFFITYPYFLDLQKNDLLLLLVGYSMQIFADFAGYSLIAIGLAALFGYRLPDNFNCPYISRSFAEFWTRWHMSLSSWLKEYLYFPLGGNRLGQARTYANLIIVMVLGGLWHGAGLSYAVWGAWHGLALAVERPLLNSRFRVSSGVVPSLIRGTIVFSVVTVGWLLFKLPDFNHVIAYLKAILDAPWRLGISNIGRAVLLLSLPVVLLHLVHVARQLGWSAARLREPAYGAMIFLIALNAGPNTPFIYFQF